jgi:hypothetical protein
VIRNLKERREMAKNRIKTIVFASILTLLMTSVSLITMPETVKAQQIQDPGGISGPLPLGVTPNLTLTTIAYMSIRPNPVGLNQIFLVNIWLHPPIHVSRLHRNFTVTIQKPNGDTQVIKMDSYHGDTTAWFEYIADQEGTWKLKFDFLGTYYPSGTYILKLAGQPDAVYTFSQSCYYKPSSTGWQELVVKKDYVALSWPPSPLPTDYWERPIHPNNREWWPIAGNYPWRGTGGGEMWDKLYPRTNPYWSAQYNFIPWVQAPNSAHIVWKQQENIRGLVGGDMGQISLQESVAFYPNLPNIIYSGRAYQLRTKVLEGKLAQVWQCYDIRTGEIYWERSDINPNQIPTYITYVQREYEVVPGETAFMRNLAVDLLYVGGGRFIRYDPWVGAVKVNVSISPLTTGTFYRDPYLLSVQDLGAAKAPNRYRLINWTVVRKPTTPVTYGIQVYNNISWPISSLPATTDFNAGVSVYTTGISHPATGVAIGQRLIGIRLKDGAVIWNVTTDLSTGLETFFSGSTAVADHGKFAVLMNTGEVKCWDLATGNELWTTPLTSYPWGTFGSYHVQSAYGFYYSSRYDGVHAIDWETGKVAWSFHAWTPYQYETPYQVNGTGVYSFHGGGLVADGKLYVAATEHTPSEPLTRGWRLYCLNATTGECIWNITASPVYYSRSFFGVVADGYLLISNEYDGYQYCFGKGKSQTTVSAPDVVVPKGTGIVIKGSVLDMSPAQPGTPCVAKESMTQWMEYLHMQGPYPSEVKGVPVTLTAIKSDGKVIDLGTVTTNGFYGTFSFAWTPPEEGTYTIIACFMGDDSYGSSAAATAITVGPPPKEIEIPEMPEIPTPTDYTPILAGLAIAIIAVAVLVVYAIITVRKLRK